MDNVRNSSFGSPHPQDAEFSLDLEVPAGCPTPAEILGQIARVIAVCLGLGLMARLLIAVTGLQ